MMSLGDCHQFQFWQSTTVKEFSDEGSEHLSHVEVEVESYLPLLPSTGMPSSSSYTDQPLCPTGHRLSWGTRRRAIPRGREMMKMLHNMPPHRYERLFKTVAGGAKEDSTEAGFHDGRTKAMQSKTITKEWSLSRGYGSQIGNKENELLIKMFFPSSFIRCKMKGGPKGGSKATGGPLFEASNKPACVLPGCPDTMKRASLSAAYLFLAPAIGKSIEITCFDYHQDLKANHCEQ